MQTTDIGYSVPFSALALKPFAVPEKESAGPLNYLLVELPAGVAGAGNGYGVVTTPLTATYLDEERRERWPAAALTRHTAPPSISVPWEVLERAEHAALSMLIPPSSAYVIRQAEGGHALLVVDRFRFGDPEATPAAILIPIPEGLPTSPAFLQDPALLATEWRPDGFARFDAKFLLALTGLGKKVGADEVTLEIRDGGPTTIAGRQNTGPRFFASMIPALLTERDDRGRTQHRVVFDGDEGDVVDAASTPADRAGAEPRTDRALGTGVAAPSAGGQETIDELWRDLDNRDDAEGAA